MSSLKLASFTPLNTNANAQTKKKVITIWKTIFDSNDSLQFRNPVDWKGMGLLDYPKYVSKPMDLNTISKKLRDNKYMTVENVLDDIQLIFDNCKVYNAPGSWIYNLADKLEKSFIKMVRNFIPKIVDANPKSKINPNSTQPKQLEVVEQPMEQEPTFFIEEVSYNDKIKFSDKLTHISSQNLEIILKKILQKNPGAVKILPPEEQQKQAEIPQIPQNAVQNQKEQKCEQKQDNQQLNASQMNPQLPVQSVQCNKTTEKPDEQQQKEITPGVLQEKNEIAQPQQINQQISLEPTQQPPQQQQLPITPLQSKQSIQSQPQKPDNHMQAQQQQQPQTRRGRRVRSSRNIKNQKKQTQKTNEDKLTIQKMQIGTKAQIFIDDLSYQSFEELMKMIEGMVQEKDKVMKKIKLD